MESTSNAYFSPGLPSAATRDNHAATLNGVEFMHRGEQPSEPTHTPPLSDAFYRAVYDLTPVMMHSMDARGRLVHVNDHWLHVMGYCRDEVIGQAGPDFLTAESREYARKVGIPKTFAQGHIKNDQIQMIKKNGEVIDVLVSSVIERDVAGDVLQSYTTLIEVTEQVRARDELVLRNAILNTQQEMSLDGILVVDPSGAIVSYNSRFRVMWAIPDDVLDAGQDERALKFVLDQLEDSEQFLRRVRELYERPGESSFDEIKLRDGRIFDRFSSPMIGESGELFGRVWYFRDITRRREAEAALRESEDRLKRVLDSAMDAIVTIDAERTIRLFNHSAEKIFRCRGEEVIGTSFDRFSSPSLQALLERCVAEFAAGRGEFRQLWAPDGETAKRADGGEFPIEATFSEVPSDSGTLCTIILRDVLDRREAEQELHRLKLENQMLLEQQQANQAFDRLISTSPQMAELLDHVKKVARTDATVLILGETGTGKELIARAIHEGSLRNEHALICVNCAALPSGLIESELFGHEIGAFTGAVARKLGRFELADRATLFLDEIGDLPLELQAKLLRALQEGEFERLGGTETQHVDVRVIAATHRDLEQSVEDGTFREDLFYRLNVVPIEVPPLRERPSDIPLLASHFMAQYATKMGKRINLIADCTRDALTTYGWPGNVRELQNVIERAVILSDGPELELALWRPSSRVPGSSPAVGNRLEDVERDHILKVLQQTNWRVSGVRGAAELLDLKPSTLQSRMKKLNIQRQD